MSISNIFWRLLAILLGCAATVSDGYNTLSHAVNVNMTHDIIIAVAVIIVIMVFALPISIWSFTNQNKKFGMICALVFIGTWVVSYGFSVNRMGTNRMNEAHEINKANMAGSLATERLVNARAKLDEANRALAKEEVTGKGDRWKEAFNLKQQAEKEVAKAESEMVPLKTSMTFEKTHYLVYALPLVIQAAGVIFFLIGFGALKRDVKPVVLSPIGELLSQPIIQPHRASEQRVLEHLKACAVKGQWHTTYRQIEKATGVNVAFVKEHLTDLLYREEITIDGSSKGRGTWGRINMKTKKLELT